MDFSSFFPPRAVVTAPFILAEAPVLVLALHSACHFISHTHTLAHTHIEVEPS